MPHILEAPCAQRCIIVSLTFFRGEADMLALSLAGDLVPPRNEEALTFSRDDARAVITLKQIDLSAQASNLTVLITLGQLSTHRLQ